ncbi:MAG: transglutaminaseTgpA domain-containing protein [Propionibacteriaceae bacterium]|nr:transglutaminaseTgpA domain-containing protein [Propionibacteriaceae bacterium]
MMAAARSTATAGTVPPSPWSSQRWRGAAVDATALVTLLALVALAFFPTYGTAWVFVTVIGAGLVGLGTGLLGALRDWRSGQVLAATVAAWFLLGTPLVMPSAGLLGVMPTGRSLWGLATGPVTAWRDMLTLAPPIGETVNLLAVPALVALAAGLLASSISLRSRHPLFAWVPLAVAWLGAITLGASVALWPVLAGACFFAVVLLWTSQRRARVSTELVRSSSKPKLVRGLLAALSLLVAVGLAAAVVPLLAPTAPRITARQVVEPPINIEDFTSPLQGFRANITKNLDALLLETTGVAEGQIIRLATLDGYDGVSFSVATTDDTDVDESTFSRVGEWIADDTEGDTGDVGVTIHGYQGVWVPTVGRTTAIRFEGDRTVALAEKFFYNGGSGTGITLARLQQGDAYSLSTIVPDAPTDEEIARAAAGASVMPSHSGVPDSLRNRAHDWGDGVKTAGAQALALRAQLQNGYFSHGQPEEATSVSGHSGARLSALVANPERMVGDGEQYATAMVLMARELGIPARVIYGYSANSTSSITGSDVGAWAELEFEELGWVVFSPTPPPERVLDEDEIPQRPTPQPHIDNPPPPAKEPDNAPPDDELPIDPGEPPAQPNRIDWAAIGVWAAVGGIPLLTIVVPMTLVLGLKMRRRSRRRNHPNVANRVAGAWAELVDRARDLGRSPSPTATRSEQAEQLVDDFRHIRPRADPVELSRQADRLVFAPEEPAEEVASRYWVEADAVDQGMRRSVPLPRWVLARLSTKSFRKLR